jgi:hypothetical protein
MTGRRPGRGRRIVQLIAGVALLALAGLEIWTRQPVGEATPVLDLPADVSTVVLVIHGAGDADNPLMPVIVAGLAGHFAGEPGSAVRYLRWSPESDERLRAAATARAVGQRVGAGLAALGTVRELHLVAHSVGAFMPDAICRELRTLPAPPRVTMVLLDPFQISGFVDWGFGARHHGECADFALAVMNLDDPAPATNRPLQQAFNLDVTADPARAGFDRNGHYWPVRYYLDHLLAQQPAMAGWSHGELPRGAVRTAAGGR